VAIVPVGTGNDFYRLVGSVRRVDQAVDALVGGQLRYFDVGRVRFQGGESLFVNLLGVGVDVEVLRRREGFRRLKGLPQYLAALVSALARFRPHEIRIELEGPAERIEGRTLLTAVTVGPSVGGGFLLSPAASAEDGLLDLFFAPTLGPVKLVRYIPRVIRGTHQDLPELRQRRFARGRLERPDGEPFFFELDGERMPDPVRALEIDVLPGRLPILLPPRGS
jgi:diacylglycerol kinase family enzyme